jgi:hypothetical protein
MQQWNNGQRLKGAATFREEKASSSIFRKTVELGVMKKTVATSISP